MSVAQNLTSPRDPDGARSRKPGERSIVLAFTAGAAVSNVYYNQPLLELIGKDLPIDPAKLGLVSAVTLGGLALATSYSFRSAIGSTANASCLRSCAHC